MKIFHIFEENDKLMFMINIFFKNIITILVKFKELL